MTLGEFLRKARDEKGWSLREVEKKTHGKVSNGYLSLLESNEIKQPSPHILHTLAKVYDKSYGKLMESAGYIVPTGSRSSGLAFSGADDFDDTERREIEQFIEFIRHRREGKQ